MNLGLTKKVAVVVAASKGLGKAVAMEMAAEGCYVSICSRNGDEIQETGKLIQASTGTDVFCQRADVTNLVEVGDFIANTVKRFGNIHILVTNAGGPPAGFFNDLTATQWLEAFNQNLMSVVHLCSQVVPHMRRNRWGRIINIASLSVKQPIDGAMLSNSLR